MPEGSPGVAGNGTGVCVFAGQRRMRVRGTGEQEQKEHILSGGSGRRDLRGPVVLGWVCQRTHEE